MTRSIVSLAAACLLPLLSAQSVATTPASTTPATTNPALSIAPATNPGAPLPASKDPGPGISIAAKEYFLQNAAILDTTGIAVGITKTKKLKLSDGKLTHSAHWQTINEDKPIWKGKDGTIEKNFRDTYKFNIAAYRVAKMLHLENMIPVSMERTIDGQTGAITWWVDNLQMSEEERRAKHIPVPADQTWVNQLNIVRVFDQLIYNIDRNQGNLLITNDWKVWMIDHTRAFRTSHQLLNPNALTRCDFKLLQAMKALNEEQCFRELSAYLRAEEIRAMLARRDIIVHYFESEASKKGNFAVLSDMPQSTPRVTIP